MGTCDPTSTLGICELLNETGLGVGGLLDGMTPAIPIFILVLGVVTAVIFVIRAIAGRVTKEV